MKIFYRNKKAISLALLVLFTNQIFYPTVAVALTAGPSQPEVQSFQQAGTTDMVDLFSGDFSYNIPLFELPGPNGGYPFNLSYQAGIGMDQEASWVGLGWSLNPGAITRQMRGLPDEFKGDVVSTRMSINPNITIGMGSGVNAELFGGSLSVGLGFGIQYNNYKGPSYSIDGNVGFSKSVAGMSTGIGLDFSLNSKEGVSLNPSLSLGSENGSFGVSAGYNSKEGLSSVSASTSGPSRFSPLGYNHLTLGATLSLVHPGYTPQISMPMKNLNLATTFKIGGSWWGIFGSLYGKGFYNDQRLQHDKKNVKTKAYGYLHYQNRSGASSLLDVNREKDGIVTKYASNLAIPSLSYDIYSVAGQGISAMYRPLRNDYGAVFDPETISKSVGGALGVDIGPAASHIGVNLSLNHAKSVSGRWKDRNDMADRLDFHGKVINDLYEPWYFKAHGEPAYEKASVMDELGGEQAVRVQLDGPNVLPKATNILEGKTWSKKAPKEAPKKDTNRGRKSRSQSIQPYTNEELLMESGEEILPHFRVDYLDQAGEKKRYDRRALTKQQHHIAGFTALTAEGLRYNYGIPAYNILQEEVTFSAKKSGDVSRVTVERDGSGIDPAHGAFGTDKFLKRVDIPKFAHSHLLTSILGPDYVDVKGDGVTEDDLGYWVKFTYRQTATESDPYKWRDPYSNAHYQRGWESDPRDDKGSYTYGEKEMWYLASAETKSHIATFKIKSREDGRGVGDRLQKTNITAKEVYSLEEITLYARASTIKNPIKVVKFKHDYSLCKGVDNNSTGQGKLTLKQLTFEYGGSSKGNLNPYIFSYDEGNLLSNPGYDIHAYDRWGNYKPYPFGKFSTNHDFPYCEQDPSKKEQIDANAGVWSLKEIQLPSGGKILIDYESDDYGYVQHQQAMQMMEIAPSASVTDNRFNLTDSNVNIRFKLETPISGTLTEEQQRAEVLKYLDVKRKQLYFKIKINLRSPGEKVDEFVSGYADINLDAGMGLEIENGKYAYGYFQVKKEDGYHPFSMRAWQHLRTNQPDLANSSKKLEPTEDASERVKQIKSLGGIGAQIRQMFEGFYKYCSKKDWGREVVADKSWIRLNSPDRIKYGGGLRVKQITMQDQWKEDSEGVYGQVYDYTTKENGQVISSGVAAYEPFIGGDENALRYAKKYVQSIPLRADNVLFFEYPINETYYPGPQIGYRKVSVTSLSSATLAGNEVKHALFPNGEGVSYGTSGKTVHEFYTAKEFPVITDETEKKNKPFQLVVPIPLLGSLSLSKLSTSQGYSIVTNDMHGKPKMVSNFRQDKNGVIEDEPISYVKYNYVHDSLTYQQEKVCAVNNFFKENSEGLLQLATKADQKNINVAKFTLGQENEFFADMREFEDNAWTAGANINVDIVYILWFTIPVFTVFPSISKSTTQLRTSVTNKVIFKSGVLESVEAFDGGSTVLTKNLKWNKITGAPVVTVVNNNFDKPVYTYTIPAFTEYQGMGASYQNTGFTFEMKRVRKVELKETLYEFSAGASENYLVAGDEILLYAVGDEIKNPLARVIFMGKQDGSPVLYSAAPLYSGVQLKDAKFNAMIVRSGYRNQLTVSAGSITALEDPSKKGTTVTYSKSISVPANQ